LAFTNTRYLGSKQYDSREDRMYAMGHYAEGVAPAAGSDPRNACIVSVPNPTAAAYTVNIAAGWCYVQGDNTVNQGMYADYNDATLALTGGRPGTGTRVDIVVARIYDAEQVTGVTPLDQMFFTIVVGTTVEHAASAWVTALRLATLTVPSGTGAVTITDDRRLYGPAVYGEDGSRYRIGIDANGVIGVEAIA